MIRRLLFSILLCSFALTQSLQARSFFDTLYQQSSKDYHGFISRQAAKLYDKDEDTREKYLEEMKVLSGQSKMAGDSFFIYRILTEFVMDTANPGELTDEEDIRDLQGNALEFLIDQVGNDEISVSSREYIIMQLGKIANSEFLPVFDHNESAVSALGNMSESDNLTLHHSAIVKLKPIALKWTEKWGDLAEQAAGHIIEDLGSSDAERQRIALIESIDVLKKVERGTDAVKSIWEGVSSALADIRSPILQKKIRLQVEELIKQNSGQMFKEQVEEAQEALEDMEEQKVHVTDPFPELLPRLADETDPVELEGILTALSEHAKKDRTVFNTVFAKMAGMTLLPEISAYKLRLINNELIKLTHQSKSSLFFYRTALILLGEISVYRSTPLANIPLTMLGNLLRSTDYPELVIPVIQEVATSLDSDLPIWIGNRFIGLIFIQAGDSPNEKIAMFSAKRLVTVIKDNKRSAFRWEASLRMKQLSLYASSETVQTYAKNWK